MAKAGHFEDLRPASTDVGGFKRVHVSHCNTSNMDYIAKAKVKDAQKWKPHLPVFSSCAPGSAADMATQKGKLKTRTPMSAPAQVPTAPDDAPQDVTPEDPQTVDPKPVQTKIVDPKPVDPKTVVPTTVDPKLLVTSRARGPPARRSIPAKGEKPGKKVRCFHVL